MSMQSIHSLALAPQGDLQTCLRPPSAVVWNTAECSWYVLIGTGNVELLFDFPPHPFPLVGGRPIVIIVHLFAEELATVMGEGHQL